MAATQRRFAIVKATQQQHLYSSHVLTYLLYFILVGTNGGNPSSVLFEKTLLTYILKSIILQMLTEMRETQEVRYIGNRKGRGRGNYWEHR